MFYNVALYISLIIFALGLIFKVSTWFRRSVGIAPQGITPWVRVTSAFKAVSFRRVVMNCISLKLTSRLMEGQDMNHTIRQDLENCSCTGGKLGRS